MRQEPVWEFALAGCSKRPFSKAAASEGPEAYPLGYVEGLNDARTMLTDFFSSLMGMSKEKVPYESVTDRFLR